jgi:PAS domain S-box-containing protein
MNQKHSSIQRKLMQLVLVTSGVVLFLMCTGFFAYEFFTYRESNKDRLSTLGEIISANSTAALAFDSPEDATEILQALGAEKHIVAAGLYDNKGNLFARYPAYFPKYNLPLHPATDEYKYENGYLKGFQPVIQENKRLGTLYLQSDMNAMYTRFERYGLIALLVVALSIFVAYLLSRQLQKKISEPILALAKTAANVSNKNDYTVRAKKFDDDELGVLTDAFNQMLTQIEKQNAEIKSFNHELELKVNERTIELEQANIELKLRNEFEETIIDSSVDIIAVFDKDLKYVTLNKSGKEAFGLTDKEVIGKNILEVFPQIKTSIMYDHLQKVFETGEMILDEHYTSHISDLIMQNFFIPLLNKDDRVYRVLVIGHDITEISRSHEQLKQLNSELEKSNLDLEQFAFIASHDLQEPLRKIQTFSQLLERDLENKDAIKKHLSKIISSASRMSDLIKAVLNYSRLSNKKGEFEKVDLQEVVDNVKGDLELKIIEKEAVIRVGDLPVICGDPSQLNQLFLNLVSNSIKFSERKPEITISSAVIEKKEPGTVGEFSNNGKYVELIFKDNGIGFEQHLAEKIFSVFQRLHGKQEYPGTGIGLALCKKIVENHRGEISVQSTPGEGTEFTVLLPMNLSTNE